MEFLLTLAYAFLFIVLIKRMSFFRLQGLHPNLLPAIFVVKILAGYILYLVYTYFYTDRSTADIFKYFDDSNVMYDALFHRPADFLQMITGIHNDSPRFDVYYDQMNYWYRVYESNIYNDSHTIIRFNALIRIFSFGYYNVHTVFMCFFSLAGLTGLYRFFAARTQGRRAMIVAAVFLMPSALFWGSGVLKEGLIFLGMGMLLWHLHLLLKKEKVVLSIIMIAGSLLLLSYAKFYVIVMMLPLLIAFVWCDLSRNRKSLLKYLAVLGVFLSAGLSVQYLLPGYDMIQLLVQKQHDFISLSGSVQSGSRLAMDPLEPTLLSLVIHTPGALYNSLLLPWFFQGGGLLMVAAGLENLLVLLLVLFCLVFAKWPVKEQSILWLCLFFALGILTLTGLTTPVMGAIVRYKVPALPFLLMGFFLLIDLEKLRKRLPWVNRMENKFTKE